MAKPLGARLPVFMLLLGLVLAGCQSGRGPVNDPFLPGGRPPARDSSRWSESERRDDAREISTSPATDRSGTTGFTEPLSRPSDAPDSPDPDVRQDRPARGDPFWGNATNSTGAGSREPAGQAAAPSRQAPQTGGQGDSYGEIRRRLDQLGARFVLEANQEGGESLFRATVPHPSDRNRLKVFEARDRDELRAMRAVVEAIEAWLRQPATALQGSSDDPSRPAVEPPAAQPKVTPPPLGFPPLEP